MARITHSSFCPSLGGCQHFSWGPVGKEAEGNSRTGQKWGCEHQWGEGQGPLGQADRVSKSQPLGPGHLI